MLIIVLFPINGHSKRRTQAKFCSNSYKNFLKSEQVISGHSGGLFSFTSLQITDTINNLEVILAAREEEHKKQFVKCYLFQIFFTVSNFLVNYWKIFSWPQIRYLTGISSPQPRPPFSLFPATSTSIEVRDNESSMYNWGDQAKNLKINKPNFLIY